jgi:hypothetical protein
MPTVRAALLMAAALVALALASATSSAAGLGRGACPATDRPAPVSDRAGAARSLVPPGANALLLCRYGGVNDGSAAFRLRSSPVLVKDASTVARYARDLDALKALSGVVFHCPADTGTAIVAYFRYPTGPDDPVTLGLDGCMLVTNGHVHRTAGVQPTGRRLVSALEALVPLQRG